MTTLERTLTKALTEIVIGLDHADDDAVTPEAAMALLNPVIVLLDGLCDEDRRALVQLIIECADEETDSDRQLTAWEMPETLGLTA
ncbi:hypothetical protein ACQEVF_58085 [Nonomuraea polychroma]|uniref:hypothetical protein n=1 Tax=Nonomuraea polychroma TaxID=46176 RepID=UPI003D8EC5AB